MGMTHWPRSGTRTPDTVSLKATGDSAHGVRKTGSAAGASAAACATTEVGGGGGAHDAHAGLRAARKAGMNVTGQAKDAIQPGHSPTAHSSNSSAASQACVWHLGLLQAALPTHEKVPYGAVLVNSARRGDGRPADSCRGTTPRAVRPQASSRPPRRRVDFGPTAGDPPLPP
jgi:hypothetical protein